LSGPEWEALEKIESELCRDAPELAEAFDVHTTPPPFVRLRRCSDRRWGWAATLVGLATIVVGILFVAVVVAFTGFVLVTFGLELVLRDVSIVGFLGNVLPAERRSSADGS